MSGMEKGAVVDRTPKGKKIHINEKTTSTELVSFRLSAPCANCPFRNDIPENKGWLGRSRAEEIAKSLFVMRQSFQCHKTTEFDDADEEDGYKLKGCEAQCAGASIMQRKLKLDSNWMQLVERLNLISGGKEWAAEVEAINKLDLEAPVFGTVEEFIEFHA